MHIYSFEKLDAWQKAQSLTFDVYRMTESFPKSEMFGLTNQLRRSSVSVSSNIAEGSGRATGKDKAHFTTIAYGSLMEVLNQLMIAKGLEYINTDQVQPIRENIEEVGRLLTGLKKSQLKTVPSTFTRLLAVVGIFKLFP